MKIHLSTAVLAALVAAALFGGSTPLAKQLIDNISPLLLAGLLYIGSGTGLILFRLIKDKGWKPSGLRNTEWFWFAGAIIFGGIAGPFLLMLGLVYTHAAMTSLLLNLEGVLTAVLAWVIFKESTDRRIIFGMVMIVIGGAVLAWPNSVAEQNWVGSLAIASACLCWAIDNNLTRKISGSDALFIAGCKGFVAGGVNFCLALLLGATLPVWQQTSMALLVGFFGYGISLVMFVLALRGLGTARTGAYFSTAPFIGAAIAIVLFQESTSPHFWVAALFMGIGVWIHLTESHEHEHAHEGLFHSHPHCHDEHHQHDHHFPWDGKEPHVHPHEHEPIMHAHHHYPDTHHRHKH